MSRPSESESAPLLSDHDASPADDYSRPINGDARIASRLQRYAKILRVSGLVLSILGLVLIIAFIVLVKIAPLSNSSWRYRAEENVIGWYIASVITAIIILCAPLPALVSFANDVTFLVGFIVSSVQWIDSMPLSDCNGQYDWRTKKWTPPHPKCKDYQLIINIIMGFVAAFGILLATSYALLLVIRVYNVFRSKSWRSKLPGSGEITWTVSLNVLTDGHERTYGFSVGAKADSKPTQGPVHL
ncbi:hypothetical protein JR316_0009111 [Psilocybe cubensis]|uniref:Uncharacterized protein n=2 Tax=Psilocybe cubensis TaxID=181762 RepID=A0ACB8GUG0_PSICU|nr:hypothetical protein JR316_0009111 [Psilocybe cubensis]KAH9478654.1 hypothetical protein JR316_0009111 [Psilocybe cubensis]